MCNQFFRSLGFKDTAEWCELNPGQDPVQFWLESVFPKSVFPKSRTLIVKKDRMPAICQWGFQHPSEPKIIVNNARVDKLDSPMWASAFKNRRCLLPATAFVEWGKQYKFLVSPINQPMWCFAGLWNTKDECTLIMGEANAQMAPEHDRLPVILHKKDYDRWLIEGGYDLLVPYSEPMKMEVIGERKVKAVKPPKKTKPPPEHQQGSLF